MKWVTRENATVARIACPWLIKRFVDLNAEFLYVPADCVLNEAQQQNAIAHGFAYLHGKNDHKKIELETPVYDALYAFFQHRAEHGHSA